MKKKVVSILLTAVMAMTLLTACGKKEEAPAPEAKTEEAAPAPEEAAPAEALHIEIVSKGFQHSFWQSVLKGAEDKAAELGATVNFKGPNTESDIADQVQMLNDAINKKPAAIALAALDTQACMDSIKKAQEAGIPIIGFDSGVPNAPEGAILGTASTDNYNAGALAADETFALLKARIESASGPVRIGVIAQDATGESVVNRGLGFIDRMGQLVTDLGKTVNIEGNDKYVADCKITKTDGADVILDVAVPSQITSELSTTDCVNMMSKKDTICLFGSNQHSGEAMVSANETMGKFGTGEGQIVAVAFDSGEVIRGAIADGTLAGAVTQAPISIGANAVDLCVKAAKGEAVSDVDTGCKWYTAANMEDPDIAPNLY